MRITSGQRTLALEMVQKLAYTSSKAEYDDLYAQLQKEMFQVKLESILMKTGIP